MIVSPIFPQFPVRLKCGAPEWKGIQEGFKGERILAPGGIAFAGSRSVFAGYPGHRFSNRAFNLRLRAACRTIGVKEFTADGSRHSRTARLKCYSRGAYQKGHQLRRSRYWLGIWLCPETSDT
jgi:hypothetical protein